MSIHLLTVFVALFVVALGSFGLGVIATILLGGDHE